MMMMMMMGFQEGISGSDDGHCFLQKMGGEGFSKGGFTTIQNFFAIVITIKVNYMYKIYLH